MEKVKDIIYTIWCDFGVVLDQIVLLASTPTLFFKRVCVYCGSRTKGRITKGRITKGRMTKGRMTKGRKTKGRMTKGRTIKS